MVGTVKIIKKVTNYVAGGKEFMIVKLDNNKYGAIDYKFIQDGKVTVQLNGFDMCLGHTVAECLERVDRKLLIESYVAQGYDVFASVMLAHGYSVEDALKCSKALA